jgi:hypothetical protein
MNKWLYLVSIVLPLSLAACTAAPPPSAPAGAATGVKAQLLCPESLSSQRIPCGDPTDPPDPTDETVLTPQARILAADAVAFYDPSTGELRLNHTAETDAYSPGLVVVGGLTPVTPAGVAPRRITSISDQGGLWLVSTTEAALTDVIEEGSLDYTRAMRADEIALVEPGDVPASLINPQSLLRALTVTCSTPGSIFNKSFDKFGLSGCIDLGVEPHLSLKIHRAQLESFEASVKLSEQAKAQIDLLSVNTDMKHEWKLGSIWFTPFEVMLGPVPLLLAPYVEFTANLDGSVSASFSYTVEQNASYKAGIQYKNGSFSKINERRASVVFPTPNWNNLTSFKGDVKASLSAKAGIGFYVTVAIAHADGGVYGIMRAYGKATVDTDRHPLWQVTAGPQFCVGYEAHLEVLLGLIDKNWSGEKCGNEIRLFEQHSLDVGPVQPTGVNTWQNVTLDFVLTKGQAQIVRVDPSGGETEVGYLTGSGSFDLTPYIDPVDDTQFKIVGISIKSGVYRHDLSMKVRADGQPLWDGGTKACGSWPVGCGSRVEFEFNVNKDLALFEPIPH